LALVPVASLLFAWASALPAAEADPTAAPPVPLETVIHGTMAKRGKVHYGPSLNSREAAILEAGAEVEVLGVAQGLPDWYVIRFPRAGTAWVHSKALQPLEDGKTFRIIEDRARARDDATLRGTIIAELAKGEVVESKGKKIGDWQAVYPSSAVAYVHKSVLNLPNAVALNVQANVAKANLVDQAWLEAKAIYVRYKAVLDAQNFDLAAKLDWSHLHQLLAKVAKEHTDGVVRTEAAELDDKMAKVVSAAEKVQQQHGIAPLRDIPGEPPIVVPQPDAPVAAAGHHKDKPLGDPPTTPSGETPPKPPVDAPAKPSGEAPPKPPGAAPKAVDTGELKEAAVHAPSAPATLSYAVIGIIEEKANAQLGTSHIIEDQDGKAKAYLKVRPGSTLQLSEFYWRNVGVIGEVQEPDPAKAGTGDKAPLVIVDDIRLLH
jgi:uncharacterized protein YgiM (DUF1202 family)